MAEHRRNLPPAVDPAQLDLPVSHETEEQNHRRVFAWQRALRLHAPTELLVEPLDHVRAPQCLPFCPRIIVLVSCCSRSTLALSALVAANACHRHRPGPELSCTPSRSRARSGTPAAALIQPGLRTPLSTLPLTFGRAPGPPPQPPPTFRTGRPRPGTTTRGAAPRSPCSPPLFRPPERTPPGRCRFAGGDRP